MKKAFSLLMILALLVLFAATYLCSSESETAFAVQVARVNQQYPGLVELEVLDYQRGLFLSTARTSVKVWGEELILLHQLRHLPWKVQVYSRFGEGSARGLELAEQFAGGLVQKGVLQRTDDGYLLEVSVQQEQGWLMAQTPGR